MPLTASYYCLIDKYTVSLKPPSVQNYLSNFSVFISGRYADERSKDQTAHGPSLSERHVQWRLCFFAVDILKTDLLDPTGSACQMNDIYDQEVPLAYRALFILSLRYDKKTSQFKSFEREVRKRVNSQTGGLPVEVNYYSQTFHDAVLIYAAVMNETMAEGISVTKDTALYVQKKFNSRAFNLTGETAFNCHTRQTNI